MDSYKTIETKLRNRESFNGNSMNAHYTEGAYMVYSYATLIAYHNYDGELYFNPKKYSVTTSRHQNLVKKAWGL